MEEVVYTSDELEFLELLKWFIEFSSNFHCHSEADDKARIDAIEGYKIMETEVLSLAKSRTKFNKELADEKLKYKGEYLDVACTKCKYFTALKPKGEKVGDHGFIYAVYECPKCKTDFSIFLPIATEDRHKVGEMLLKKMRKKKVDRAKIEKFETSLNNAKAASKNLLERNADIQKFYDKHQQDIAESIVNFMTSKHNFLSGGKNMEIN